MAGNQYLGRSWFEVVNRKLSGSERIPHLMNGYYERILRDVAQIREIEENSKRAHFLFNIYITNTKV